jgi:hypothetical protein
MTNSNHPLIIIPWLLLDKGALLTLFATKDVVLLAENHLIPGRMAGWLVLRSSLNLKFGSAVDPPGLRRRVYRSLFSTSGTMIGWIMLRSGNGKFGEFGLRIRKFLI